MSLLVVVTKQKSQAVALPISRIQWWLHLAMELAGISACLGSTAKGLYRMSPFYGLALAGKRTGRLTQVLSIAASAQPTGKCGHRCLGAMELILQTYLVREPKQHPYPTVKHSLLALHNQGS